MSLIPTLRLPGWAFAVVAVAILPLALVAPRTPTALIIAAAVISLAAFWRHGRRITVFDTGIASLLVILVGWVAVSALWSLDTYFAVRGALKLAGNIVVGGCLFSIALRLAADERTLIERALAGGFWLTVAVLAIEALFDAPLSRLWEYGLGPPEKLYYEKLSDYGIFWLKPATSLVAIFVWPVALSLSRKRGWLAALLAVLTVVAVAYGLRNQTALFGLLCGLVLGGLVLIFRRRAGIAAATIVAAGILIAPLLPATVLQPDRLSPKTSFVSHALLHRLYIWEFTAENIAQHPLRGWGMNAARVLPGGKDLLFDKTRQRDLGHVMPLHPHNLALQMWLELGLPGALFLSTLVAMLLMRLTRPDLDRNLSAMACGQFAAGFVISSFSFGAWQSWWLMSLWFAASLTAIHSQAKMPADLNH
ncbi:MAG: O-antigen ligase family protein [Rhodospirillales bacterium]|jgi:O-antigen ligase|nr:O-antigen ligase family protein [Rhodospirillales bacterium]